MCPNNSPAAALADFVSAVSFEQIPEAITDWTLTLVKDNLGCALGALALPEARSILAVAEADPGATAALLIGGRRASVGATTFCNSQLANLLDFDDTYDSVAPFHPGCLIIPAALAVAQSTGASGREFLTAVTVAYEVSMRVGRSFGNTLWNGGASWTAVGELAAAIAAAKLYRLDAARVRALFSVLALDGSSFSQQPRRRTKGDMPASRRFGTLKGNFGSLAQMGVWAAIKARAGHTGFSGLLEWSFSDWYRAGFPESDYEGLTANLGGEYMSPKVSLKPTPSCRQTHSPITAAWHALAGRTLVARDVARIRVLGVPRLERTQWSTVPDAQFSIPCALALAVSGIEPGPKWYVDGVYKSTPILELAAKVVQEVDPAMEEAEMRSGRITCRIEIELKDGKTLTGESLATKGSAANPLSAEEQHTKFGANAAHLHDRGRAVDQAIQRLTEASTIDELSDALATVKCDATT